MVDLIRDTFKNKRHAFTDFRFLDRRLAAFLNAVVLLPQLLGIIMLVSIIFINY